MYWKKQYCSVRLVFYSKNGQLVCTKKSRPCFKTICDRSVVKMRYCVPVCDRIIIIADVRNNYIANQVNLSVSSYSDYNWKGRSAKVYQAEIRITEILHQ